MHHPGEEMHVFKVLSDQDVGSSFRRQEIYQGSFVANVAEQEARPRSDISRSRRQEIIAMIGK